MGEEEEERDRERRRALTFCDVCLKYLRSKKIPLKCMHPTLNVSTLNCKIFRGRGVLNVTFKNTSLCGNL